MPAAETARLIASLELKDLFSSKSAAIGRSLGQLDKQIDGTQGRAYKAGTQIGVGIKRGAYIAAGAIGFLSSQVVLGLKQLASLEDATAATNAGLLSTKHASGQTADSIRNLAEKYEALNATIDDKVIQSGENVLLTFTNIRKQAFEPALAAALDLSVGMKQDLQTSIVQIGKALNDPIKGLTSLSRIGVAFTADQKKQIAALVKTGDTLGAQKIILAELSKEFGGRFKAAGSTATGTIAGIGDAVEDLQKAIATGLFPIVQRLLPKIRAALASPEVLRGAKDLGDAIAGLFSDENIRTGIDGLKSAFRTAKEVAPAIADAARITGGAVKEAVSLFKSLPPELQTLLVSGLAVNKLTGGLVTNIAGGLISSVLKQLVSGVVNVNGAVVNVVGAGGIPSALPGVAGGAAAGAGGLSLTGVILGVGAAAALGAAIAIPVANAIRIATGTPEGAPTGGQFGPRTSGNAAAVAATAIAANKIASASLTAGEKTRAAIFDAKRATVQGLISSGATAREGGVAAARAIDRKHLAVTVPVNVSNKNVTYFNGRIVDSNLTRYNSTVNPGFRPT